MYQEFRLTPVVVSLITAVIAIAAPLQHAIAEDDPTEVAAATVDEKYSEHKMDVKRLFASRCSWCHQAYGMKRADGPRLAGTSKNRDQLIERIARGKSPMPGFRKQLKPFQMEALADYIKALPDYAETQAKSQGRDTGFPDWSHPEYQRFFLEFYERFAA